MTAPRQTSDPISHDQVQMVMCGVDGAGDRMFAFWACGSLEISPFTLVAILLRTGLLIVNDGQVWMYDPTRKDYIPYRSPAGPAWWGGAWGIAAEWLEQAAAQDLDEES